MPSTFSSFEWHDERLSATIARAYTESLRAAEAEAEALKPSSKVTVRLVGNELTSSPAFFEEGARPHTINDPHGFLYLKGQNRFVSTPVHHPGSPPKPHLAPAAVSWARSIFQNVARVTLGAAGFR